MGVRRAAPHSVAVVTLGCPKNLVDSEVMAALLGQAGLVLSGNPEASDGIVINTCAFMAAARDEAWAEIEKAVARKREGRCRALVVAGCLAQGFGEEILRRYPEVDRLLGTGEVDQVVAAVAAALEQGPDAGPGVRGGLPAAPPGYLPGRDQARLLATPAHYAYLKIAEGCNHRCAFCLIPALRGGYRSRPPDEVVREARTLVKLGVRELVLVAQDTTIYGRDIAGRSLLADLVRRVLDATSVPWLRVLYGYPRTLTGDFVELLEKEGGGPNQEDWPSGAGRLCRYLDLPMQHASDPILRAMSRPETGDYLLGLVQRLRARVPGITLRSTFIVGFPGESERDFQVLLDFLTEARFEHAGFFAYSREAGTPAAELPGQVPEPVKRERLARAAAHQREICLGWRKSLVGRSLRVLVDRVGSRARDGSRRLYARSEADAPEIDGQVAVTWPPGGPGAAATAQGALPKPGDFVHVRVTGAAPYDLFAEPASGRSLSHK